MVRSATTPRANPIAVLVTRHDPGAFSVTQPGDLRRRQMRLKSLVCTVQDALDPLPFGVPAARVDTTLRGQPVVLFARHSEAVILLRASVVMRQGTDEEDTDDCRDTFHAVDLAQAKAPSH